MLARAAMRGPLASLLFFTTGATALAYQVVWFKRFSHTWGNSSLAMAGVVAGFLLGLGLGARLLSGWADRTRSPLSVYGGIEVAIALLSLTVPWQLDGLARVSASLHEPLENLPWASASVRLAAAALALGPPCLLMGATLPLLVRAFAGGGEGASAGGRSGDGLGRATSWFYAINTAGAAFGCLATGFFLLPTFGLLHTHLGAVAVNAAAGAVAFVWGRRRDRDVVSAEAAGEAEQRELSSTLRLPRGLRGAAFATGWGALVLQMVWARQLALTLGGTTYAFSAVVLVVLVGIGVGSLLLRGLLRRGLDARGLFVTTTLLLVLGVFLGQLALPSLAQFAGERIHERASPIYNAALCLGASAVLEFLPSLAAGVLFPLLVHLSGAATQQAGRAVGRVYAWNTVGTTLGATLPTLFLLPAFGAQGTLRLALLAYLAAPLLVLGRELTRRPLAAVAWSAALAASVVLPTRIDHFSVYLGQYLYGPKVVASLEGAEVLLHEEGSVCDVLVLSYSDNINLRVNGKVDASTYPEDQVTQLGTAYLPRFLRPDAEDVLVVGYGSGASAGGSLLFPATQRLTCLEIEPAVFAASPYFSSINHSPENSPRFELIIDDGRSHLMSTPRTYDMILTEPSNPWMAGVANLFTLEFYRAARERLRPGGILGQWMQTYALSEEEYSLVVRTLLEVFPECLVLVLSEGDTLLLASDEAILPSAEVLDRAQGVVDRVPAIARDLQAYFEQTDVRGLLLSRLLMGTDQLRSWSHSQGSGINTDGNMRLEFGAPLRLFQQRATEQRLSRLLLQATGAAWIEELMQGLSPPQGREDEPERLRGFVLGFRHLAALYDSWSDRPRAAAAIEQALQSYPGESDLEADRLFYSSERGAAEWSRDVALLVEGSPPVANRLGVQLGQDGAHELSIAVFEPLVERFSDSATLWLNLSVAYDEVGRREEARAGVARALALDPNDAEALELQRTLAEGRE